MVKVSLGTKGIDFDWKGGGNPVKDPPKGLEPVGDSGWYTSPEVVDPRDCRFYPDSPWCGGNPIDLSLQVEVEINIDPCGITFTESGSALIKTPQFVQTYRLPGACRREYEAPPPVVPPPPIPEGLEPPPPTPVPEGFGADEYVAVGIVMDTRGYSREWWGDRYTVFEYFFTWGTGGISAFPSDYLFDGAPYFEYGVPLLATSKCEYTYIYNQSANAAWIEKNGAAPDSGQYLPATFAIDSRQEKAVTIGNPTVYHSFKQAVHNPNLVGAELYEGRFGDILKGPLEARFDSNTYEGTDFSTGGKYQNLYIRINTYRIVFVVRRSVEPSRRPPSLPPEPRNCDCMQCCFAPPSSSSPQQQQQQNDALLKQILAECKKMNKALGSDLLPAVFPKRVNRNELASETFNNLVSILRRQTELDIMVAHEVLTDIKTANDSLGSEILPLDFPVSLDPGNTNQISLSNAVEILNQLHLYLAELANKNIDLEEVKKVLGVDEFPATLPARLTSGNATIQIENIPQLLKQQIIYNDETIGEYPIKLKIEDTDPTQSGNQSETLEFANTSEILAEAFGAMMNVNLDTQILVQLATKALIELGVTRKQLHTTQSMVDALCQYVGFASEERTEDVPFTFTVPIDEEKDNMTLEQFCKESTQKVEVLRFKGRHTQMETDAIIRHMHGIVKGVFFRGVARDAADIAGAIKDIVKKQSETMDKVAVGSTDDLDNWAEEFEMGFSTYTGGTTTRDPAKPYGLPLDQRPRIQIIRKPGDQNSAT